MKNLQLLKEFCTDQGELQYLCKEFNCSETIIVYTKEQAEILSLTNSTFRDLKETMNKEELGLNA